MRSLSLDKPKAVIRFLDFSGDGLPLVFIHGLGCASSSHFPVMVAEPVVTGHRRVLVDLFGHGYSDRPLDFGYSLEEHADTVAQVLDSLSLTGCGVFGHSMGGAVAISLAALRPDLVSRLILAEANLDPGGGFISTFIAGHTEEDFVATGHQETIQRLIGLDLVNSAGSFRICGSQGLYRSAVGLVDGTKPTMRERLYGMRIPRAFLVGERSLPDPNTEELPKRGIQCLVVSNAGHDMMFDNPAGVASAIQQTLRVAVPG